MGRFLICTNPQCRYLVKLQTGTQVLKRSEIILDECPECGHPWTSSCPFCGRSLKCDLEQIPHRCEHCAQSLRPQTS
jgi:hypothetical protein